MTDISSGNKVMRAIFSPAVALLDRLNYTKKFTLLWLVSLTATAQNSGHPLSQSI